MSGNSGDRMYQVRVLPPPAYCPQSFSFPRSYKTIYLLPSLLFFLFHSHFPTCKSHPLSTFLVLLPFFKRTKPPISLGQGPFQRIHHPRMSTTTSAASAPKLEKKPVKFSNLLLGAGLNLFEVTSLGQVWYTSYHLVNKAN